ncbi:MAG: hypothetical protein KJ995_02115, partial [Candidatus Omnitrophica bacterium]|nr:hypothetical protein [Candidatus Omnitrophota bacterium]MBU1851185.1 hypothetical protein [Candidatus Omnitrophota bacterium]
GEVLNDGALAYQLGLAKDDDWYSDTEFVEFRELMRTTSPDAFMAEERVDAKLTGSAETSLHVEHDLPPLSVATSEQEKLLRDTLLDILGAAFSGSTQNIFDGKPLMISLPVNSEVSGISIEEFGKYMGTVQRVRVEAHKKSKSVAFNIGNITFFMFEDNADGHELLSAEVKNKQAEWGVSDEEMKTRNIAYSFAREMSGVADRSFTVLLEGSYEQGKFRTPTPFARCISAAIKTFNLFDLTRPDRKGVSEGDIQIARVEAAERLIGISGLSAEEMRELVAQLVEQIAEVGLLALSGKLFIKVQPVDWNDLIRFHEAEQEALRSV